jgi:hypothetical protein
MAAALAQGCGSSSSKEGPPFQPNDIQSPQSLLITNSDIEAADATTPYGVVLHWFRALQRGNVKEVRTSYVKKIPTREARRQIDGFQPRFSEPVKPLVRVHGSSASVDTHVRSAAPYDGKPNVIAVLDFHTHFYLGITAGGWRLRTASYQNYLKGRQRARLAVG